jgi:diguanylate cyclase (GGDEF)-like protein
MKKLIPAIAVIFLCCTAASAVAPAPLTSLRAIHALTNSQAGEALPVAFEATVTYDRWYEGTLFVVDGGDAVYVQTPLDVRVSPGDRVLVRGKTHDSYRPEIFASSVTVLHPGQLPKPVPVTFDQLIRGQHDCMLVTVHAIVRTADMAQDMGAPIRSIALQMITDGGVVHANVDSVDENALNSLLDAEVEVTGVVSGRFDGKMQLTGLDLNVSGLAGIRILKRAGASPWTLPVTPMDRILGGYHENSRSQRVLVRGVITYYQPGTMIVLQNGAESLRIMTEAFIPLRLGDQAEATGFPELHDGFLTLIHAEVQDSQIQAPVQPMPTNWQQLSSAGYAFNLVSIEAQVVMEVREASTDEYVLLADGHLFSAIYRHPAAASRIPLPAIKHIPIGSKVRVTGICLSDSSDPFSGPVSFDILLRSFGDITLVARPPLLNVRNLVLVVGLLLIIVFAIAARGWTLERKTRRQTAAMAALTEADAAMERRRSRILEDINGIEPLAAILEEIASLVSFQLDDAPCWCEITDGARLGQYPAKIDGLRILSEPIPARSGPSPGAIFAGLGPETQPAARHHEALSMGARLAALAIETRKLYSDLLHRSEFDRLTNIHNRFSLEKYLDAQIEEARQKASILGLIYIDLDDFKQVNDHYSHHVGDLYLQEVTVRMKRQLRSGDLLARLGGDEFAVLVPTVRNRAHVEEMALRLEHSFDEPLTIEGCVLHGSASFGIALYPEDGATRESLLSAADAAMYASKNTVRKRRESLTGQSSPHTPPEDRV